MFDHSMKKKKKKKKIPLDLDALDDPVVTEEKTETPVEIEEKDEEKVDGMARLVVEFKMCRGVSLTLYIRLCIKFKSATAWV